MSIWLPSRASLFTPSLRRTSNAVSGSLVILPLVRRNAHITVSTVKARQISATISSARHYASSSSVEKNKRPASLASKDNGAVVLDSQGASSSVTSKAAEARQPLVTRVWAKVKHEANHYWDGTKLLGAEIKISWRLLRRLLKGKQLTRRERRQVRRASVCHSWMSC